MRSNAMTEPKADMSTDEAWEQWGQRDPYFGVITDPKFRRAAITEDAKREFFESGASHVHHVLLTIRQHIDHQFVPRRILDFGCGVGRTLVSFAGAAQEVVGADVSPSMLQEARHSCDVRGLRNVQLVQSDDELTGLGAPFDLIHSFIVFQHIPTSRGRLILAKLLQHLVPGGAAAIHVTYSKARFAETHGVAPPHPKGPQSSNAPTSNRADPEMQMNPYNMNKVMFLLQQRGVQRCYTEFSDHGGEFGAFLFFSLPGTVTTA